MRKKVAVILSLAMSVMTLAGCGANTGADKTTDTGAQQTKKQERTEVAVQSQPQSSDTIVLRLAETQTETYPATMGAIEFARLVNERSGGRIKIEVFPGGQLGGDEQAVIEQVQFALST